MTQVKETEDSFSYCAKLICAFLESWYGTVEGNNLLHKAPEQSQTEEHNIRKTQFQGKNNAAELSRVDIIIIFKVVKLFKMTNYFHFNVCPLTLKLEISDLLKINQFGLYYWKETDCSITN